MKTRLPAVALAVFAAAFFAPRAAACSACAALASSPAPANPLPPPPAQPAGHPLRGVVVDILPEQQALLVKHEEIPGVMKAMTMLLKVDAATLAAAKKDQPITGTLIKKTDGWWLEDVKPAPQGG